MLWRDSNKAGNNYGGNGTTTFNSVGIHKYNKLNIVLALNG